MNVVYMGTPEFAVPTLRALYQSRHRVLLVVTQPDRPGGRGLEMRPPAVKQCALELGLDVAQPEKINSGEFAGRLRALAPDAVVVVAYGKLLKPDLLSIPRHGCINLHASLLPKYRGAAPINWALIRGETETGVTSMKMNEGMDTGDILLMRAIPIQPQDNARTLHDSLSQIGAGLIIETLDRLEAGTLTPAPQDHARATLAPKLGNDDGRIVWKDTATDIFNRIRGLAPKPGAFTFHAGRRLNIHSAAVTSPGPVGEEPGCIRTVSRDGIEVATGRGCLRITELQPEGKKPMSVASWLQGHALKPGERFADNPQKNPSTAATAAQP